MRAEQDARVARDMAQQAAEMARQAEGQAQLKLEEVTKKHEEAMRQLKLTEELRDELQRQLKKNPEEVGLPIKWGTLEGRVVWKGELPDSEDLQESVDGNTLTLAA